MLLTLEILTVVFGTVGPGLNALAMLLVVEPLAHIGGTVSMSVGSMPMSFVVAPLAFIDVAICVHEFAEAVCLVSLPLTFVLRAIWPDLMTIAVLHPVEPLTSVNCSAWQGHGRERFSLLEVVLSFPVVLILVLLIIVLRSSLVVGHPLSHLPGLARDGILVACSAIVRFLILCGPGSPIILHHVYALLQSRAHRI